MVRTITKKENREAVAQHRQREKDRAELMALFSAATPEGIGEHISMSLEMEDGEPRLVWNLDDVGAKFINEFAASIKLSSGDKVPVQLVMRELSLHIGKKLTRREYDWQSP